MAKKRFAVNLDSKQGLDEAIDEVVAYEQYVPAGVRLSPVKYVPTGGLRKNPLNQKYFTAENEDYVQRLTEDIKARGIIVPLIAKPDGLLLAGHYRLHAAKDIELPMVPVQRVLSDLTGEQERDFLLKDNVLRRQLTPAQKEHLIRELYGEEIFRDRRGGDRKSAQAKIKGSGEPLKALHKKVEADTGGQITAGTAKRVLAKIRKERKSSRGVQKPKSKKLVFTYQTVEDLIKQLESTIKELRQQPQPNNKSPAKNAGP